MPQIVIPDEVDPTLALDALLSAVHDVVLGENEDDDTYLRIQQEFERVLQLREGQAEGMRSLLDPRAVLMDRIVGRKSGVSLKAIADAARATARQKQSKFWGARLK